MVVLVKMRGKLKEKISSLKLTLKPKIFGRKIGLKVGKVKCPFKKEKIWGFKISFRF